MVGSSALSSNVDTHIVLHALQPWPAMAVPAASPLAAITRPFTATDLTVLGDVLHEAEALAAAAAVGTSSEGPPRTTLVHVLDAYDTVLRRHGIFPSDDTFYYRTLLKLSLDTDPSWWARLDKARKVGSLAIFNCSFRNAPAPPALEAPLPSVTHASPPLITGHCDTVCHPGLNGPSALSSWHLAWCLLAANQPTC